MPVHEKRIWCVVEVESAAALAEKLVNHSWCLCTGFRLGPTLWLNDAFSEDGAQEYSVFRIRDMVQVESVTASWIETRSEMVETIETIIEDLDKYLPLGSSYPFSADQLETPEEHRARYCHLCA